MDLFTLESPRTDVDLEVAWKATVARLALEVPTQWMERFVRPLQPVSYLNGIVRIEGPGRFVLDWVRDKILPQMQGFLGDELGRAIVIELQASSNTKAAGPSAEPIASAPIPKRPEVEPFEPNERFTFENYVVGQSNRLAVAGAKAVAEAVGRKYNPLFIYGPSGLGKTHLLHAIAREIQIREPRLGLVYVSAQQFAEEFIAALQSNRTDQFRRLQRSHSVWLVDDIQFIAGKDKTQEEIFHTFNHLHSLGKQIVLTSDRPPRDLYLMDERLRSRFEAGLVADVQMPDTETRCAILQSKANLDGIEMTFDVAMYLASYVPGNIRVLEGALTKLTALASVERAPLSIDLAESMVDRYYRGTLEKPGVGQILETVGKHYKIAIEDIRGPSRKAPIVQARHVAVFIAREVTGDSWKHLGSLFGDRDHTSMMHGYQKINEQMHHDKELKATVNMLLRNVHPEQRA
ncbi:chromosomal replication initiator protein DnaA [bacterium]|nr:MAG: chromosomal replication initiator protein DnaA [bacterium]